MTTEDKNKEQAILEAAEKEFLEKGFDASKTTQIASLAGVTHAMLHYYYRTKENLFNMVFDRKVKLLRESLFVVFNKSDLPFLERLQIGIEAHFDFLAANPQLPRFILNELISKPKRRDLLINKMKSIAGVLVKELQQILDKEVERGNIHRIDPMHLIINIASLNIFVFASLPIIQSMMVPPYKNVEEFLEARKKENVEMILRRLKKTE